MGFKNVHTAEDNVIRRGILLRNHNGRLTLDTTAYIVLTCMCDSTYDWPLSSKMMKANQPSRLYEWGLEKLAEKMSLTLIPSEKAFSPDAAEALAHQKRIAVQRISNAIRFLRDRGVIKVLKKGRPGMNASYLLCIGTRQENFDVEQYDREYLGLPKLPSSLRPEDPDEPEHYVSEVDKPLQQSQ